MQRTEPGPRRSTLEFVEVVRQSFHFLEAFGFREVRAEPTLVQYQSKNAFVNVYHGRSSYELNVEIGPSADSLQAFSDPTPDAVYVGYAQQPSTFSIWDVARFAGAPSVTDTTFFQASTSEHVRTLVPELANLVRRYAVPGLEGSKQFFEHLSEYRSREAKRLRIDTELRRARADAAVAWKRKEYSKFMTLLEPYKAYLTPAETKKLMYATTHSPE